MKFRHLVVLLLASSVAIVAGGVALTRLSPQSSTQPVAKLQNAETAIFAGGCFWGVQAAFDKMPGVLSTRVGYTGGRTSAPTYSSVVVGTTGHAEAVEVIFDPGKISFTALVQFHLEHVRPSKSQKDANYAKKHYRQSIFVRDAEQRIVVEGALAGFNRSAPEGNTKNVLIEDATVFWKAEAEHQNYLAKCAY